MPDWGADQPRGGTAYKGEWTPSTAIYLAYSGASKTSVTLYSRQVGGAQQLGVVFSPQSSCIALRYS